VIDKLMARKPLKNYDMKEEEIEIFDDNVLGNKQRLLVNNYVRLSRDEIRRIFKALY
jgi:4-hydroxybutyrate dehydrogenase